MTERLSTQKYTYNGISSLKVNRNSDSWYNMVELEDVMLNKISQSWGHILYDSIYMRYLKQSNSQKHKVVARGWGKGKLNNANSFNFARCTSYDDYMQNDVNIIKILKCTLKKWLRCEFYISVLPQLEIWKLGNS